MSALHRDAEHPVEQIRVLKKDQWRLYRRQEKPPQKWETVRQGKHDFDGVPVITIYANQIGWMISRPPLIDLAWLNLAHWQSSSDQRHILHVARVPLLFGRALQVEQQDIEIGPNRLILADDPAADLKFVEHSGAAIEAGRQDLIDLEDRMALMGFDMLSRSTTPITATARQLDSMQNHAALSALVTQIEQGIEQLFQLAAQAEGLSVKDAGTLCLDRCWQQKSGFSEQLNRLRQARLSGEIDKAEFTCLQLFFLFLHHCFQKLFPNRSASPHKQVKLFVRLPKGCTPISTIWNRYLLK